MFCLPSSDADSLLSPLSPRRERHQVHGQRRHTTGETYVSAVLCKTCMSPPSSPQQLRHLCDQTVINHRKPETASSVSPRHSPNSLSLSLLQLVFPPFGFLFELFFYQPIEKRHDSCTDRLRSMKPVT